MSEAILEPTYCKTKKEVFEEMARRRGASAGGVIVRFDRSPYGGYRVYSVLVDSFIDDLIDPVMPNIKDGSLRIYS